MGVEGRSLNQLPPLQSLFYNVLLIGIVKGSFNDVVPSELFLLEFQLLLMLLLLDAPGSQKHLLLPLQIVYHLLVVSELRLQLFVYLSDLVQIVY